MTQRRQPRPHFNEPEVAFNDAEALQLVRSIIGDWPWFKTAHLSSEQAHEAWRASSDAGFAYAIALARDGDFHLLAEMHRIWRTGPRVRDFPEEAYQLMEARLVGRAQRSKRSGPASGKLSRNDNAGQWVPAVEVILSEFYPELPTSQQRRWAVVLAGKRLGIKPKTFRGYWGKNKRPASAIDDPERFRHYIRWWRATGRNLMRDLSPSGEALHCARKSPGKEDENVTETFRSDPEGSTPSR